MERLDFRKYMTDCQGLTQEEIFERSVSMNIESYNNRQGDDDGSGVDCPVCRNRRPRSGPVFDHDIPKSFFA